MSPRVLHAKGLGWISRSHDATERVSSGRTYIEPLPRTWRMIVITLLCFSALLWGDASQSVSSSTDRLSLGGHTLLVQSVAFAPDGRTLASCGADHTVRLWDVRDWGPGSPARSDVLAHDSSVQAMAFSPDGQTVATAAIGSLVLWSRHPSAGRMAERSGETFTSLAFSPDGRTLALGGKDGAVRLWEMPAARERAVLRGGGAIVHTLAFSPDGKLLASGDHEGRVVLRDVVDGGRARVLREGTSKPVRTVAFSPDGRTLGVAEPAGAVDALLFDVETGAVRGRLPGQPLGLVAVAFSPDGRTAATAGIDRWIRIWDLAGASELAAFYEARVLKSVAFSPDGRWLASSSGEEVRLVDLGQLPASDRRVPAADRIILTGNRPKNG